MVSPRSNALLLGALITALAGCSNAPAGENETQIASSLTTDSGALEGELFSVSILNGPEDEGSQAYYLHPADGSPDVRLEFDSDPNLVSQTEVRVWGKSDGTHFFVSRYELVSPPAGISEIIGAPVLSSQTVAWVQMDVNGGGVTQTVDQANALIFNTTAAGPLFGTKAGSKSVVQYYDENSYGMLKLSGRVEGPIPFSGTACNNFDPLAQNVVAQVTALGRTYNHYYLYWGTEQPCGPGWGAQGTRNKPGKYVWLNNDGTFCTATGQEIGHNFGLMHASTMDCGTAIMSNDTSTCTSNEYGNPMTVMGGGCGHLISVEKWYSGFFQGCNAVKVKSSATFTLLPIETACNGIQALQIPMSPSAPVRTTTTSQSNGNVTVKFYYLELRGGVGMDTGAKTGVFVHAAADVPAPSTNGIRTFLLDMNPATNAFDPMSAGQTFSDPAGGVSFTLNSVSATKASITVTIDGSTDANTCIDGSILSGSGPDSCGSAGTGGGGAGGSAGTGAGGSAGTNSGGSSGGGAAGTSAGGTSGGHAGASGSANTGGAGAGGANNGGTNSGGAGAGGTNSGGGNSAGASAGGASNAGAAGSGFSGAAGASSAGASSAGASNTGGVGDAGTSSGAGNGPSGAAGSTASGGASSVPGPAPSSDKSGCSCEVAGASRGAGSRSLGAIGLLLACGAVFGRRRRRGIRAH
jgi:hypothetical protein